jgi:hypothetical protein
VKKQLVKIEVNKNDVRFIAVLLKMFSEMELHLKPKQIQALAEQMLVLWFRVKSPVKFVRRMKGFSERADELRLPAEKIVPLMARELRK